MTTRRVLLGVALGAVYAGSLAGVARAQSPARTGRIMTKDGVGIFVKDTGGSGRSVVLTHAWPLSADIWDHQAAALSRAGHRVITYDRRGFGRSSQPATGFDFDTFTDDLAAVIEATGVRDTTLAGYSMGGGEVVRYFSRHKGRNVVKAGLVGAAAYYLLKTDSNPVGVEQSVFDGIKQGVLSGRRAYLSGLLRDVFFDAKRPATYPATQETLNWALGMAMQASEAAIAACVDAFSKTDFRSELAAVNVPTLVLHGTADIPVPIALGRETARGIPSSKLIEYDGLYDGVSHGLVVTERDRVTRDLMAFIAA